MQICSGILLSLLLLVESLGTGGNTLLFLPETRGLMLCVRSVQLEEDTPQALVDALVDGQALPEGVKVISFTEESPATLNISEEFLEALHRTGTAGEMMMVYALTNTFVTAYGLEELTLLCEGEVMETGHDVYSRPLEFCEEWVNWEG